MGRRRRRDHWDVLLAEDNDDHALLIQRGLRRASPVSIEVRRARNGDEVVQMVEDLTPDLILLDLKMPGRNGHEVLAVIKADDEFRRIPVAVLTSSDQDRRDRWRDIGAVRSRVRRAGRHRRPTSGHRGVCGDVRGGTGGRGVGGLAVVAAITPADPRPSTPRGHSAPERTNTPRSAPAPEPLRPAGVER